MGKAQDKNVCWLLPRPKPDHYKGGMPLYAEEWLLKLAEEILGRKPYVLNLFCGMNKQGVRIDLNPKVSPTYIYDAHKISELYPDPTFDVILADPPYSDEETKQLYGDFYPKLHYKKWTGECDKCLKPGGLLIVYHKFLPANPNPKTYFAVKRVCILNRIWHLPRVAVYFQKGVTK